MSPTCAGSDEHVQHPVALDDPLSPPRLSAAAAALAASVQVALGLAFYQWYAAARHLVAGSDGVAQRNALRVVGLERALGIFNESSVQAAVASNVFFRNGAAFYYGTVHFVMPVVALVVLYRRDRTRYFQWRNAFAWMSVIAVVIFAVWPLMPPRLLPGAFHFHNIAAPGIDRPVVPDLYNGYAAMPSLHMAYSMWALFALWPVVRSKTARSLLVTDVVLTLFAVVATANHYYLDAVGGGLVLFMGVAIARRRPAGRLADPWLAALALLAAAAFIWLPKGAAVPVIADVSLVLVVAGLAAATAYRRAGPQPEVPAEVLVGELVA